MLAHTAQRLLPLFLALGSVSTAVLAQDSGVRLRLDLEEGSTFRFEETASVTNQMKMGAMDLTSVIEYVRDFDLQVADVAPDGSFELHMKTSRVRGKLALPMQPEVTFDSSESDPPGMDPMLGLMVRNLTIWVHGTVVLKMDPRGHILELSGAVELAEKLEEEFDSGNPMMDAVMEGMLKSFTDEHMATMMQAYLVQLPAEPIAKGASWNPKQGIHECFEDECKQLETTNTVDALDEDEVVIETAAVLHVEKPKATAVDTSVDSCEISRTVRLSRADGLPLEVSAEGRTKSRQPNPMGGASMPVDKTLRAQLKRLPG